MAKKPVTIQLNPALLARTDELAKRNGVSRQEWIANALRAYNAAVEDQPSMAGRPVTDIDGVPYRQSVPGPDVSNIRSSAQAKRDVKPIPKGR